jgi:hypothetical protein
VGGEQTADGERVLVDRSDALQPIQRSTTDVALCDLDGDGDLDIVWVSQPDENDEPGGVDLSLNEGEGTFVHQALTDIADLGSWSFVLPVDVDADADLDLVLTRPATTGTQVTVLVNSGTAVFARYDTAVPHLSGEVFGYVFGRVAAADVDRDGDQDILVPVSFDTDFSADMPNILLLNEGDGFFVDDSAQRLPTIPAGADYTLSLALGDVDGDGSPDIYLGEAENQQRLLLNDGAGFFSDQSLDDGNGQPRLPADALRAYDCVMRDLDGDGWLDIVVVDDVSLTTGDPVMLGTHVFFNDGTAHFTIQRLPFTDTAHDARGLAVADLDGDGRLDVIVGNATDTVPHGQTAVELLFGDGARGFVPRTEPLRSAKGVFGVAAADLNGDGLVDIAGAVAEPDPDGDLSNLLFLTEPQTLQ